MTAPRRAAAQRKLLLILMAALLSAAALAWAGRNRLEPPATGEKPTLLLLTALPLVFGEELSLDGGGSPALAALETRYAVKPIAVADAGSLGSGRLLLMAQPLAQPAEHLVELDRWVRSGGRLMLLADPRLEWPSTLPLGDVVRPPYFFADTGLFRHWGLTLDPPASGGPATRILGGREILTVSPGALGGACAVSRDRLAARCAIGKGRATIVADADFLNVEQIDGPVRHNLDSLLVELAGLMR